MLLCEHQPEQLSDSSCQSEEGRFQEAERALLSATTPKWVSYLLIEKHGYFKAILWVQFMDSPLFPSNVLLLTFFCLFVIS